MAQTIKVRRGNKATLPSLGIGEPAFTIDSYEYFIGTSAGNMNLSTSSVRGSDISIAPTSWSIYGNDLSVVINDSKVPAEDSFTEYQVYIAWSPDSLKIIPATILTETTKTGGSYRIILLSNTPPEEAITGQVVITKVSKAW